MAPNPQIPTFALNGAKIPLDVLKYIPEESASFYQFVPLRIIEGILEVGMVDPENIEAKDVLQFIGSTNNLPFKVFRLSKEDFDTILAEYKGLSGAVDKAVGEFVADVEEDLKKYKTDESKGAEPSIVEDAPVTKIVSVILQYAIGGNASDIHIEPEGEKVRVRYRVDGVLHTTLSFTRSVQEAIVARIKILTNMKLDEKRKPQDGRFSAKIDGRKIDFRVSTLPTYFGEKVVIRILDPDKKDITFETLGLDGVNLEAVQAAISKPYGIILLTGPTGSGKTTTLYSMLSAVDREKNNVVSLEDPIEYDIDGVNQSQVQPEIGYTFANGLRSILRQDPDIIMVGEIRDRETAKLAIQAALTGHLVFSTLHTNSSIGVIPRLIDMGVEPYLIPPALTMVLAQRLVPVMCPEAKQEIPIDDSLKMMVEKQFADLPPEFKSKIPIPAKVFRPSKTASCPSGTKGRMGVFETFTMNRDLERLILKEPGEVEIYEYLRKTGFLTLKEDAMKKAFEGKISFDEVNRL
ncbi:MAG: GspE/PulE family protein [Candidatus Vogelbacteria bacterium]|nr:GspE/PulE family protein [Candidatus Vogelbacteria bacterium]